MTIGYHDWHYNYSLLLFSFCKFSKQDVFTLCICFTYSNFFLFLSLCKCISLTFHWCCTELLLPNAFSFCFRFRRVTSGSPSISSTINHPTWKRKKNVSTRSHHQFYEPKMPDKNAFERNDLAGRLWPGIWSFFNETKTLVDAMEISRL